jgi:hypothetical protein
LRISQSIAQLSRCEAQELSRNAEPILIALKHDRRDCLFEFCIVLSWHEGSLVALQRMPDGSRRLARLRLNRRGTAIAQVEELDRAIPTCTGTSAATLSGDDVYYLAAQGEASSSDCTLVVRRLRLP